MDESSENTTSVKNVEDGHVYTSKTDGEAKPMKETTVISKTKQSEGVSMAKKDLVAGPSTAEDVTSSLATDKTKNSRRRKAENKNGDVSTPKTDIKMKTTKKIKSNSKINKSKDTFVVKKELVGGPITAGKAASRKVRDKSASTKNVRKDAIHPPVSEMVLETLKTLKKRNGASVEQISGYIGENYQANVKMLKSHINKFLRKSEEDGVLERVIGANAEEKFKIKKAVSAGKGKQDLISKKRKMDLVKKTPVLKKKLKK